MSLFTNDCAGWTFYHPDDMYRSSLQVQVKTSIDNTNVKQFVFVICSCSCLVRVVAGLDRTFSFGTVRLQLHLLSHYSNIDHCLHFQT